MPSPQPTAPQSWRWRRNRSVSPALGPPSKDRIPGESRDPCVSGTDSGKKGPGLRRDCDGSEILKTSIGAALSSATARLAEIAMTEPRRQARRLIAAALQITATEVFAHPERKLTDAEQARLGDMLRRIAAHEPLSRITGSREFWGLDFLLSADTLDPRPETETLVEAVLGRLADRNRPYRLLDLGTGTGCLLLALLSELPNATGLGVDLAPHAAAAARRNAKRLGLAPRASFVAGDWASSISARFDAVVANPPYISSGDIAGLMPEVRKHDPHLALDGGVDGLAAYRAMAADLPRLLQCGGLFAVEIGSGQGEAVASILAHTGLIIEGVAADLAGIARVLVARR